MSWLTPMTGVILAAAVIPPLVLLYFLKLRRKTLKITSTLLWSKSIEDMHANAPFQRLRRNLLLLLQLIVLLLLAFAVMQPRIQAGVVRGGKTVIMIDNSCSMTATDGGENSGGTSGGETRLDEAKRRAREFIEKTYAGGWLSKSPGETMIVAFAGQAEIISRFTDSKNSLLRAIDRIQPTHEETKITEAFKLARAYTTNVNPDQQDRPIHDPATIELFSDGRISDLADHVLRGETLNYHPCGTAETDNIAITAISVERPYDRPTAVEVFAALANYALNPAECDVQISVNGNALGIQSVSLEAATISESTGALSPGHSNVVFRPFEQPRNAIIEVAILSEDDLAADNVAQLVVPPAKQLRVALVNPRSRLLRMTLEGLPLQELAILSSERFDALAASDDLSDFDVVVLDDFAPQSLPDGRYLSFGATPPVHGLNEYGEGGSQVILTAQKEHPALRYVSFDRLIISKSRLLQPSDEIKVIVEGSGGPVMVEVSRGPMSVLHITFDPLDSTWPLERSWVTFIFNAIDYLGHLGERVASQTLQPGDPITARLTAEARDIKVITPGAEHGSPVQVIDSAQLSWGPARLAGLYLLTWETPGRDDGGSSSEEDQASGNRRAFAVNALSPTEGDIAVRNKITIGTDQLSGIGAGDSAYTPLWPWAVGAALFMLMLEWWVYHRRLML